MLTMRALLTVLVGAALSGKALAQNTPPENARQQQQEIAKGDPARWYQDDSTAAAQLRTLRKEIGAALQEATIACKKMAAAERAACMRTARATYQQDMAGAAQLREQQHPARAPGSGT
jgi:hypothetical protein